MKIAVTYENGEIFQHFGHTEKFKIYEVSNNEIKSENVIDTNGSGHGALTEFLVKSLVKDVDSVSEKEFEAEDESVLIQVLVNSDEIGSVIGKGGKIANSIRTIVQASSYLNDKRRVKINIDSF